MDQTSTDFESYLQSSTPHDYVGFLLWQVSNARQKTMNQTFKQFDLTHTQFMIMGCIKWCEANNFKEKLNQTKIAHALSMDTMIVSNVITLLVKKGYLYKSEHPKDRRAYLISLTKKGHEIIFEASKVIKQTESNFFEPYQSNDLLREPLKKLFLKHHPDCHY